MNKTRRNALSDKPVPHSKVLIENRKPMPRTRSIVVDEVEGHGRNASGLLLSGVATFSDGKVWSWHRSHHTGEFYFTIDSGIASQWSCGNYGRMVAYPKRVEALKKKLDEIGELTRKPN
jgi:hypothetical protein